MNPQTPPVPPRRPPPPGEGSEIKRRDPRRNPDVRHANEGWRRDWDTEMDPRKGR